MKPISRPQQKKIQVMRRQLFGADDGAYREMLGAFKVQSSSELSFARAGMVIEHLEECVGAGSTRHGRLEAAPTKTGGRLRRANAEQLREIRRRWDVLSTALPHEREGALRRFLRRRFHVAAPEWLSLSEAQKVLNGLKAMRDRVASNQ
jgi:hypothetical protein